MTDFYDKDYRDLYFDTTYFGRSVTLTKSDNSTVEIKGIFNIGEAEYAIDDSIQSSIEISFETKSSVATKGETLTIDSVNYQIFRIKQENGIDTLLLNKN
tara:strand:- start:4802 stop:5101 length:300 start_codon:yes stop_codon:yes gene_type:complete